MKYVIHTVEPIWNGGYDNEKELLVNCYKNCLRVASENNIKSIAFPAISTGPYGYPIELATKIALNEIISFLKRNNEIEKITIVCFGIKSYNVYQQTFNKFFDTFSAFLGLILPDSIASFINKEICEVYFSCIPNRFLNEVLLKPQHYI